MELIKLSSDVGIQVKNILQKKGYEPRKNNFGLLLFEFTQEELDEITELTINNPTVDCLTNLEYCRNLQKLKITSSYNAYSKNNSSISDKDIKTISKITSLKSLTINNQSKISWLYLDNLVNLEELTVIRNNRLEDVYGLDKLKKIKDLSVYGNKELYQLSNIKDLISSNELDLLELDLLHYPEVSEIRSRLSQIINCSFVELGSHKAISYGWSTANSLNSKCLKVVRDIIGNSTNIKEIIILIEKYLAENITYDYDALERKERVHMVNGQRRGLKNGTQSAYNGLMLGSCVCEGYTRSMQYLLKLLNIKTKNVYCISGKDRIKIDQDYKKMVILPDDGYHSIIRLELDNDYYYCDPCWDSCRWHRGDKTLPYCLKSKKDIVSDHTLSFEEDNIILESATHSISKEDIESIICNKENKSAGYKR